MSKKIQPCDDCPWRKDAPVKKWDRQHFLDIWHQCQDDGMALMLCHKSKLAEGVCIPCAGAILVVGYDSIGLRLAVSMGQVNVADYDAGSLELYEDFAAMMRANGLRLPRRNRFMEDRE